MSIPSSGSSTWRSASLTSSFVGMSSSLATAYCPRRRTSSRRSRTKKWIPSTKRTQLQRVHITSECVRALSARKRTPRSRSPFETPVATTITSPAASSSVVNTRAVSSIPAATACSISRRADGHLAHVHIGKVQERPRLADGDHRHRPVASTRDDAAALEGIDRQIDLPPSATDLLADVERRLLVGRADHDSALNVEVVERLAHRIGRLALGGLVVRAAEPAGSRQCSPIGRACVGLAQTELALLLGGLDLDRLLDRVSH